MLHECLPITEILKQLGELDPSVTLHKIGYLKPTNGLGASKYTELYGISFDYVTSEDGRWIH